MPFNSLKKILQKNKIFTAVRYSDFFMRVWLFFRPAVKAKLAAQTNYYNLFLEQLKSGKHSAFDIGANEGFVSESFLNKKLDVIAVEPDERNLLILNTRFSEKKFKLYPLAAGAGSTPLALYMQSDGTALSTFSFKWKQLLEEGTYRLHSGYEEEPVKVGSVTLDQLIQENGIPSIIKIDVEGYESEVIKGLNTKVPLLLFEANLPEFIDETLACIKKLHQLDENILFNYSALFKMRLENYMRYEEFCMLLNSISDPCVDIICIMPLYFNYYNKLPI